MKGISEYNNKWEKMINNFLKKCPELEGFYYFLQEKSLTTVYNYLRHIHSFLQFAGKSPENLALDDFTKYLNFKRKTEGGDDSSSSYKGVVYHALKSYGEYLVAAGLLQRNPMEAIKRPPQKESQKTIEKRANGFLTEDEVKQVLGLVKGKRYDSAWAARDCCIMELLIVTGIRVSALQKIDLDDINLRKKRLIVTDKGSKVNIILLPEGIIRDIENWLWERELLLEGKEEDALFISKNLERIYVKDVERVVDRCCKVSGKTITPHNLRATYGSILYDKTKDIYLVQKRMMHASTRSTELYIRGKDDSGAQAADIFDEIIKID